MKKRGFVGFMIIVLSMAFLAMVIYQQVKIYQQETSVEISELRKEKGL